MTSYNTPCGPEQLVAPGAYSGGGGKGGAPEKATKKGKEGEIGQNVFQYVGLSKMGNR